MSIFDWSESVSNFPTSEVDKLAAERGINPLTIESLRQRGWIGRCYVPKWKTLCVAFPIADKDGTVYRAHCRCPQRNGNGRWDWAYEPETDPLNRPIPALIIGQLGTAHTAHILESQWDGIALIDRLDLIGDIDAGEVCVIATRGADFGNRLAALRWPGKVTIYAWPQNDKAGQKWIAKVVVSVGGCYVVDVPKVHKDLGEWVKVGGALAADIEPTIDHSQRQEPSYDRQEPESPDVYKQIDVNDLLLSLDDEEPLPSFPLDTLPRTFRAPIEEVMRHYRVPALIPVACALVINGAALGRGLVTKSNVRRTYPNLYAIIGAKSGTGKTVVFDEFMAPLEQLQYEMLTDFKAQEKPRAEAELKLIQAEVQRLLKIKTSPQTFDPADDARQERLSELLQKQAELEDRLEAASRLWCVDFTSEALGVLLANSHEQIAVLSDEGGLALYNMLGRYTKGVVTDDILLCKAKSVNATTVDRLSRPPILLRRPCVALLLLVQPDLLRMAFSNERLLVGGFLARCLSADSRIQIQYEDESSFSEVNFDVMETWNRHIRSLVKNFRAADDPYWVNPEQGVRALSRKYHNQIVDQIRGALWDIDSFAMRWVERAWEIALNLHAGFYGVECYRHPLSKETFANAIQISTYFAERQLEVLNAMRVKTINDNRDRLQEILEANGKKPVTLRDLKRRHGMERQEVLNNVKSHPELFGIAEVRRTTGGRLSLVVHLQSNPLPKMTAKQV
jgi:hypothetical protein